MATDILHTLVQRLSDRERKYVIAFAKLGHRPADKALRLLELLSKMPEYDERRLKLKFENLASARHQLRALIMRALRADRDSRNTDSLIRALIEDYEIYYEKGLYAEAYRSLNKAQALAVQHQNPARMLEVLHWQKHRVLELERADLVNIMESQIELVNKALAQYTHQVGVFNDYHWIFAQMRTEDRKIEPKAALTDYLAMARDPSLPFQTRLYAYQLAAFFARTQKDFPQTLKVYQELFVFWEEHGEITSEMGGMYKILLANYAVHLFAVGDHARVRELLDRIAAKQYTNFNDEAETFQNVANIRILLQLNALSKDGLDELLKEIEEGLDRYADKVNAARQFAIWYNIMLIHLIHGEYAKANVWIDKIVEHRRFKVRLEVQYITRILQLIVYDELGLWDLPDSMVAALRVFLGRHSRLSIFNKQVMGIFTTISGTPKNQRPAKYAELLKKLNAKEAKGNAADGLGLEIVKAWVQSKVNGTTILEELKKRP